MAKIRQEINILNSSYTSGTSLTYYLNAGSTAAGQLDTSQYNGTVTYYHEVVATNTNASTAYNVSLYLSSIGSTGACSIPANSTSPVLVRTAFTPTAGTIYTFGHNIQGTAVAGQVTVKSARIVIVQEATTLTSSETQIEICGTGGSTTTSTVYAAVTNPKYWQYTATNWDGTLTVYFEATFMSGTSKSAASVTLQTSSSITAPSWSDVASAEVTTTQTVATRVRSAAITLTGGNWYRVAFKTASSKSATTIYSAKVVIQSNNLGDTIIGDMTNNSYDIFGGSGTEEQQGFQFTTGSSGYSLSSISFYMNKTLSPSDNVYVEIAPTSISTAATATSANVAGSSISGTMGYVNFTFASPPSLSASTTYYVRVIRDGARDTSNFYTIAGDPANPVNRHYVKASGSWGSVAGGTIQIKTFTTVNPTKLEPQYLLANTLFAAGTGLQTFLTKWDSTEWSGVTNTYYFQAEAADNSTSDVVLIDSGGTTVTNSTLTNVDNAQISSAMTMPSDQNLDVKATTNAGDIAGARILVQTMVQTQTVTGPGHEYIMITS